MRETELCFYGGIACMVIAGLGAVLQTILFIVKRKRNNRRMDQEYGNPRRYNRQDEGSKAWHG